MLLLTTLLRASLVAAASPAPLRLSRILGLFPREQHIQDFWGPVSDGFKATFEYEAYYQAMSDDEVGEAIDAIHEQYRSPTTTLVNKALLLAAPWVERADECATVA